MYYTFTTRAAHSVHQCFAHFVFVVHKRKEWIPKELAEELDGYFQVVCGKNGCVLIKSEPDKNHVHLLIKFPPKVALSELARQLKGYASRRLGEQHPDFMGVFWSSSYFVKTVASGTLDDTFHYIAGQGGKPTKETIRNRAAR